MRAFYVIAVGIALAAFAAWLLGRTETGRALQAIASDRVGARAVGLPVERLLAVAFALAGVLAAAAAVVEAPAAPVSLDTGALLGLKGLVAALVVGFGSPWRGFVAGLGLGMLEAVVASVHIGGLQLGPAYRDIVPLALALVLLAFRLVGPASNDVE